MPKSNPWREWISKTRTSTCMQHSSPCSRWPADVWTTACRWRYRQCRSQALRQIGPQQEILSRGSFRHDCDESKKYLGTVLWWRLKIVWIKMIFNLAFKFVFLKFQREIADQFLLQRDVQHEHAGQWRMIAREKENVRSPENINRKVNKHANVHPQTNQMHEANKYENARTKFAMQKNNWRKSFLQIVINKKTTWLREIFYIC